MWVIKRDDSIVAYDPEKISIAISGAFDELGKEFTDIEVLDEIENTILSCVESDLISVEQIQDIVEDTLLEFGYFEEAKAYIKYRYKHELARQCETDAEILEMISGDNEYWTTENSNKDARLCNTQRDYIAGIIDTKLAREFIFPRKVVEAHDAGIIHIHDLDFSAERTLTNCFSGDTKFLSLHGYRAFNEFEDGSDVFVPAANGEWHNAKVKKYGKQKLNKITLESGYGAQKVIKATPNHRWLLDDDTETIELKVQDTLRKPPNISSFDWRYLSLEEKRLWCKGFACGLDILGYSNVEAVQGHVQFMLNSNNVIYEDAFLESQYIVYHMGKDLNAGMIVIIDDMSELMIPNFDNPIDIKIFVHGFLSAASTRGGVYSGSPVEFTSIDLHGDNVDEIVDLISAAGYVYTTHGNDFNSNITTFFNKNQPVTISLRGNRTSTMLHFVNPANVEWRVLSIEEGEEEEVWCLEVESEHSFMLEDFIPTGNCCLINLEDILQNGTVINNIKIEKPHRLITAATIASQVIAAVSGAQYGKL